MDANPVSLLRCVMESSTYLNPETKGGAHTDVLRIEAERLAANLAPYTGDGAQVTDSLKEAAATLARRFLVKRGKTRDFSMQLVGPKENVIPRKLVSHVFGPYGYNLVPTVEKTLVDASEAARQVPYFSYGARNRVMAPDVLAHMGALTRAGSVPDGFLEPGEDPFLVFLDESGSGHLPMSLYHVLADDQWFKGSLKSFDDLSAFQRFVRRNPVSREMEESLSQFFNAPITVGLRDTIRWAMGSRHPELGWEKARATIAKAFDLYGDENFLPVEMTYYAPSLEMSREAMEGVLSINGRVVPRFARQLGAAFEKRRLPAMELADLCAVSREVLEFYHGYPLYELEPYQGVLSVSTVKLLARFATAMTFLAAGLDMAERPNTHLPFLTRRPGRLGQVLRNLDEAERQAFLHGVEEALTHYHAKGGLVDQAGNRWTYRRLPRTFFSFQENAQYAASLRGSVEEIFSLSDLQNEPYKQLLTTLPELSQKLTVFFTLLYRYYKDTGFIPDLRPKNAGRDIFVLGIWGYVSENMLIILHRDGNGERHAELSFVDNKDQFKEYRRSEDRRAPVGMAKNAVRLVRPVVEPAMLRSVGLFVDHAHAVQNQTTLEKTPLIRKYASHGLEIAHEVVNSNIGTAFDNVREATEDFVDDVFTGLKQWVKKEPRV